MSSNRALAVLSLLLFSSFGFSQEKGLEITELKLEFSIREHSMQLLMSKELLWVIQR